MATPQVPPRPARSNQASSNESVMISQIPAIPPRPIVGRRRDRSLSPERDRYAPSPLNAAPLLSTLTRQSNDPYGNAGVKKSRSNLHLPQRPSSVNLPSIGQEGNEYESYPEHEAEPLSHTISAMSATQTSHVGNDLPLHAPKPGLSQSEARARVQGVTHSDNSVPSSPGGLRFSAQFDDKDPQHRSLRSRSSLQLRSPSVASTERPGSTQAEQYGIPQIGIQVPMHRHAGDVQAPSPAAQQSTFSNDVGGRSRHHNRTRSGRDQSNPPDSYGRHGHGVTFNDKFEKDWYAKHPEAHAQDGHYSHVLDGIQRRYVMSSEDLNKLVQETAKSGSGFGTTTNVAGLPDEQIGYLATEEYASRINSRPGSSFANPAFSNAASNKIDSSLKATDLADDEAGSETTNDLSRTTTTDSEIIHVEAPEHYWKTVTGERVATPPFELGTHGGNISELGGLADEKGYETPILASDEPRLELGWQKPAVLPITYDLQGSSDIRNNLGSYPGSAGHSRPGSRPGSITGVGGLSRVMVPDDLETYTPLDDVEEYEPLFDDEDKDHQPLIEAARLKRRPDTKHRFPSQDIWEDTPDSARLETEVDTPEPEKQELSSFSKTSVFEPPEAESARKGEISEIKSTKLLSNEERLAQSDFKPQIYLDARSNSQRFPSSDIWEDTPDSAHLETVVGEEEVEAENTAIKAGAVVHTTTDRGDLSGSTPREGTTSSGPFIPQRPIRPLKHKSSAPKEHSHLSEVYNASGDDSQSPIVEVQRSPTESRKAPNIPERPKPQVPARPNKLDLISPPEESPSLKSKPPVPARPAGSKIAALQAGFMSDLNNRLKLGPQALPKQTESEKSESVQVEEQAALADARKSRAKGPARRKPATSPVIEPPQARKMPKLSIAKPITVWHISPKGTLDVVYEIPEPPLEDLPKYQSEKKSDSPTDRPVEEIAVPTKSAEAPSIPASAPPQQSMGINSDEEHDSSADAKQSIGIDPLLISSGVENRVSLPDGKAIAVHAQSVDDKVTIADTEPPQTTSSEHIGTDKSTKATSPAQTGTKEIEINPNTPGSQKLTVIEGGNALTGEDVVIHAEMPKDDEGHIRQDLM